MAKQTEDELSTPKESGLKIAQEQENTRSRFALIFIWGYLLIIFILILLTTFSNLSSDSTKDFLLAIGTPLGFIVGYYFKSASSS